MNQEKRHTTFTCPFLLLTLLLLSSYAQTTYAIGVEETAPDWTLTTTVDRAVNFYDDSNEHVSVLLFWATWCPYCRSLMPHLQKLADEFAGKKVKFYALNVWEDGNPVRHFEKNGYTFTLLFTADLVAEDYGVKGTPGLMLVDRNKKIKYKRKSGEDDDEVEKRLREILNNLLD